MSTQDTGETVTIPSETSARKSHRGYEIYLDDTSTAWVASDTTVPLDEVQ